MLKRTKKQFLGVVVLVFAILIMSSSLGYADSLRVATMDFDGDGHSRYHNQAGNALTNKLLDLGRVDVISRSEVDTILDEQNFQQSGLVDTSTAQELGNILGVDKIFVGNVDRLTTSRSDGDYNGETQITIRLIDVSSGQILTSYSLDGSSREDGRTDARAEAINDAFGRDFERKLRQRYAITSFVEEISISGDKVDLFGGREMGISSGDRYYVLRDDNGFESKIGKIEIEQTSADRARAKVLWQIEPIEVDDRVREVAHRRRDMTGIFARGFSSDASAYKVGASISTERAFAGSTAFDIFYARGEQQDYFGTEGNLGIELSVSDRVYFNPIIGAGLLSEIDRERLEFYGRLGAGLKFYPMYDSGFRVRLGVDGQLSSEEDFEGIGVNLSTTLFRF